MIHELNHLNGRQVLSENATQNSIALTGDLQNKEVMVALSKVQIGDILSGKLILENNQTMLKLESGLKLMAHLPNQVLADQLLDFLVVGKGRQHLELEQVQINGAESKSKGLEEAIMKELQLPHNTEMKQIVDQWMDKQLPLIKNQILQVYHLMKNYDLPSEALMNLSEKQMPLSEHELKLVSQFKIEGMQIVDELVEGAFNTMTQEDSVKLSTSLSGHLSAETLKSVLEETLTKYVSSGKEELLMSSESNLSGAIQEPDKLGQLFQKLTHLQADALKQSDSGNMLLEDIFKALPKEHLKKVAEQLIHKYLIINQEDVLKRPEELFKMSEMANRLKEVVKEVAKHIDQDGIKQPMQTIEQMANVLDKYNTEGQYYCFPLQIKEQQASGELYFFKPKKQKKGNQNQQGMYIVLALDMPSLKHIEIHLAEEKEKLTLKIKVANDEILEQMKAHEAYLRTLMDETMMPIGDIHMERIEKVAERKTPKKEEILSRLDFRI